MTETDSATAANKETSTTLETLSSPAPELQTSTSPPPAAKPAETVVTGATSSSPSTQAAQPPTSTTSPTPPPINEATRPSMPEVHSEERSPVNVQLAALRAMFPDYDDAILVSVLESVNGDQDRAVDALLGMSDPNYTSEARPEEPALSQTDLDEQLARQLMLQDEQEQQRQWQQQNAQRPQFIPHRQNSRTQQQVPYQQNPPVAAGGERDTMAEVQEQFSKIAETGKKTFGTLFSKVKAKIQEFDQPRPGQSSTAPIQPAWGVNDNYGAYNPSHAQQAPYGQYQPQPSVHQQQPQPAYYDPNPAPVARPPTHSPPVATAPKPYDMTATQEPAPATAAGSSAPGADIPRATSPAAPIDGVKLGLLPKKPVSLMRDPAATQPQRKPTEDDDDGLEYTENPFEDSRK